MTVQLLIFHVIFHSAKSDGVDIALEHANKSPKKSSNRDLRRIRSIQRCAPMSKINRYMIAYFLVDWNMAETGWKSLLFTSSEKLNETFVSYYTLIIIIYEINLHYLQYKQHNNKQPNNCIEQKPKPMAPRILIWSRVSSMNRYIQPVYGILLGWSLLPHPSPYVIQHESGTIRFSFGRILFGISEHIHSLYCQSSKRSAPQHLYCNNKKLNESWNNWLNSLIYKAYISHIDVFEA